MASENTEIQPIAKKAKTMRTMLEDPAIQGEILRALPKVGLDVQRFTRAALTAMTLNPQLYECSRESVVRTLIISAQYGLPLSGKFGIYPVPFRNNGVMEMTPIVDYRGLLQIARRSGEVLRVTAEVVREGDIFDYEEGSKPFLRHKVASDSEDAPVTHVYALAHLKGAENLPAFVVLTRAQVEKYRARSKARNSPMWTNDWDAAARKTAIRRLCESGRMPMQDGDQRLVELLQSEDVGINLPPYERTLDVPKDAFDSKEVEKAPEPKPESRPEKPQPKAAPAKAAAAPPPAVKPEPKVDEETGEVTEADGGDDLA